MVESWVIWLFVVGVALGVVVALVVAVRLPRQEDDVSDRERSAEAAWISGVIERHGGIAPDSLVEEVLDLHQAYLRDPRLARPPGPEAGSASSEEMGYLPGYPAGSGLGYPQAPVPGYPPVYPPDYPPASVPVYPPASVPGYAGAPVPGHAPVNGPSGPVVGPAGTPTAQVLDRRAQ